MERSGISLEQAVRSYLEQVIEVTGKWSGWLAEHEQALLLGEYARLEPHAAAAQELFAELSDFTARRQSLLDEAERAERRKFSSISELARTFPAWKTRDFRDLLAVAHRRMSHLKRLNLATWVLVSQCAAITNETVHLLIHGKPEASVYIDSPMADDHGGQLLDAKA